MLKQIKLWLEPPYFPGDDDKNRRARLINILGLYFLLLMSIAAFILVPLFARHKAVAWAIIAVLVGVYLVSRRFMFLGRLELSVSLIVIAAWAIFQITGFFSGGITSPFLSVIIAATIIIGIFFRSRAVYIIFLLSVLIALALALLQTNNFALPMYFQISPMANWFLYTLTLGFVFGTVNMVTRNLRHALDSAQEQNEARQRAEEQLHELVRELKEKNTELEQFTYTVSHDLKAPLITIRGFLGLLKQDIAESKQERIFNDLNRIDDATEKMNRLLSELLELSRIGRLMNAPQPVAMEEIVKDALNIVHGRIQSRGITVQTQPNLPIVHGDRQRLTEVLQNLLDNAAKFMGDHTNPLIEIGQHGEDAEGGQTIFFVKDNGVGIAPEYHERVFGLFNKLDPNVDGTGIGLALVKRIIEFHKGRIWVESTLGAGSTFYFTLPKE